MPSMDRVSQALVLAAVVAALIYFSRSASGARKSRHLSGALNATAVAILFISAGVAGYELNHGVPFTRASAWSDGVIWSQIVIGAGAALVAVHLWRRGLRSLRSGQQALPPGSTPRR